MDIIVAFFIGWAVIGAFYFGLKTHLHEKIYKNETKLGKALTIFIGGPITWVVMMVKTDIKFLNKKVL